MTENAPPPDGGDIDAVRADIAATRSELADTVDELTDRLNVPHRAADAMGEAGRKVAETATRAKQAAPEPVQHALDRVGEKAGPIARQANERTKPHRGKIVAGLAAAAVVALIAIRRGRQTP
jgi:hypothetical protein